MLLMGLWTVMPQAFANRNPAKTAGIFPVSDQRPADMLTGTTQNQV
jgi:hypothetical protein